MQRTAPFLLATALAALSACSPATLTPGEPSAPGAAQVVAVAVEPSSAEVGPGVATTFTAAVYGTSNGAVVWTVQEAGGGSVDAQGLYTAPAMPGTYHVIATSAAAGTVAAIATVTVSGSSADGSPAVPADAAGSATPADAAPAAPPAAAPPTAPAAPPTAPAAPPTAPAAPPTAPAAPPPPPAPPVAVTYALHTSVSGSGTGAFTCNGGPCAATYPAGAALALVALPHAGSTFGGWSGACSGTGGCSITMNGDAAVVASFALSAPARWSTGYYYSYFLADPSNIDWAAYTHVAHMGKLPHTDGSLGDDGWSPSNASALVTAAHAQNVKVLLTVGGANAGLSPGQWPTGAALTTMAANLVDLMNASGYDGIDLDREDGASASEYVATTAAIRAALPAGKLLTCATGSWIISSFTPAAGADCDQVNLMSYKYSAADMPALVNQYVSAGFPKATLGVGFGMGDPYDAGELDTTTAACSAKAAYTASSGVGGMMTWGMGYGSYSTCEAAFAGIVPAH